MLKLGKPKPVISVVAVEEPAAAASTSSRPDGTESDECLPAPDFQNTFGDALQAAFDNLKTGEGVETGNKKKKGKKQKGKLLFSM